MIRAVGLACVLAAGCDAPAKLTWIAHDEAAAFARARSGHLGVLVDCTVTWAEPSVRLDRQLDDPSIVPLVAENFVPLRFDVSDDTEADRQTRTRYQVASLPALVFVAGDGTVLGRVTQTRDVPELEDSLRSAIGALHATR